MRDQAWVFAGTIISSGALSAAVSGIVTAIRERRKKRDGQREAARYLLYRSIKEDARACIANGFITTEELEDLKEAHRIYHDDLNGNGFLDAIMKKIEALPIKEK